MCTFFKKYKSPLVLIASLAFSSGLVLAVLGDEGVYALIPLIGGTFLGYLYRESEKKEEHQYSQVLRV